MKKIFGIILIASLTSLVTFAIAKRFIYSDQIFSSVLADDHGYKMQDAKYTETASPDGGYTNLENAAEKSIKAVVHIKTESKASAVRYRDPFEEFFGNPFGQRQFNVPQTASGSGVIISNDGYIVTNNHVVEGADEVSVTFNNLKTVKAKVIAKDANTDLAVLKVDETNLPYLSFGNSDNVRLGEWVLAVGYPLNLETTVTAGIVSAKYRNIGINQRKAGSSAIESFIQTDAAVNPGNSGGALVNAKGELIGINSAIASPTGSYAGYSYAIPANIVKKVVNDMIEFGNVQRAYLGVAYADSKTADENLRKQYKLDEIKGVYITDVLDGGSAKSAGIKSGDVITKIGDNPVNSGTQLQEQIARLRPGDNVVVTLERDGKLVAKNVEFKNNLGNTDVQKAANGAEIEQALGVRLRQLGSAEAQKLGASGGVQITEVMNGAISRFTRIRKGFVITEVNEQVIKTMDDLGKVFTTNTNEFQMGGFYPGNIGKYYFSFRLTQ